jgi:hypothetical protein
VITLSSLRTSVLFALIAASFSLIRLLISSIRVVVVGIVMLIPWTVAFGFAIPQNEMRREDLQETFSLEILNLLSVRSKGRGNFREYSSSAHSSADLPILPHYSLFICELKAKDVASFLCHQKNIPRPIDEELFFLLALLPSHGPSNPSSSTTFYLTHPLGRIRWRDRDIASPKILNKSVSLTLLGLNIPISNRIPPPHSPGTCSPLSLCMSLSLIHALF